MPDEHAAVTCSGADRWIHCPPSVRLSEPFPDTRSPDAELGVKAHSLCEQKLNGWLETGRRKRFKNDDEVMQEATDGYRDYVIEIFNVLKARKKHPALHVEVKLDLSKWIPEGFGTSDAVIVSDDELHVIDFKYGTGVQVFAEGNPQLRLYALGALNIFWDLYEFDKVKIHIYQPRKDHVSTETISVEDLLAWGETIKPLARQAFDGTGEMACGEWCRFCRCSNVCRKRAEEMFAVLERQEDKTFLSLDEIAGYLPKLDDAIKWAKGLQDYALERARAGDKIPGWKLVEGRSVRKITDPTALADAMKDSGYQEDDIWKPRELQTLTSLEKTVGKKTFAQDFSKFIEKPKGKPVLVPESDKRKEWSDELKAEEMFGKE